MKFDARRRWFEKVESRVFCGCEICCLRFRRMLHPSCGGEPIRFRRIPGFAGNFSPRWLRARQRWRCNTRHV